MTDVPNMPFSWEDPLLRRYRGMTARELVEWDGLDPKQAAHVMAARVYGVGYELDKNGDPIERGIGSAAQQTAQHKAAVAAEARRQALIDAHAARLAEAGLASGR